jgi:hypothetical protein
MDKSLCVLNISSWNGGIDMILERHLLDYSDAISHLLHFYLVLLPKSTIHEQFSRTTIDNFCELLKKIFNSWLFTLESRKVKVTEVLILSENMKSLQRMCTILSDKELLEIDHMNNKIVRTFKEILEDLRDEVLPLITINKEGADSFKRLVVLYYL